MVCTNSIAPPEYPKPVRILMPVNVLIVMAARGVNIRDLLLSEVDEDRRRDLTAVQGGPTISGTLHPSGVPFAGRRIVDASVVFTLEPMVRCAQAVTPDVGTSGAAYGDLVNSVSNPQGVGIDTPTVGSGGNPIGTVWQLAKRRRSYEDPD